MPRPSVTAVWEKKSMQRVLRRLNNASSFVNGKLPLKTASAMAAYALEFLKVETPAYSDTHRPRPHHRPGGPASPTIRSQWTQSKARRRPDGSVVKTVYNKKMATTHGRTVLRVLEAGSRPHVIKGRPSSASGGLLTFYWEAVGEFVMARQVFHPGTAAAGMVGKSRLRLTHLLSTIRANAEREAANAFYMPGGGPN